MSVRTAVFSLVGALFILALPLQAGVPRIRPVKEGGELILFDVAHHDMALISNYTTRWKKGSDLVPVCRRVTKGGKAFVEISYKGTQGAACSTMFFEEMPECEEGTRYAGLKIIIDCDKGDYPHISVAAHFSDDTQLTHDLTLDKGMREYVIKRGFRRAKFPPKWELLQWVWLSAKADKDVGSLRFRLKSVRMIQEKTERRERTLEVTRVRKVREIFPAAGNVTIDGGLNEQAWTDAQSLAGFHYYRGREVTAGESPFSVRITYDSEKLYIAARATFPTPPLAQVMQHDREVYQDEAQEFFFSAETDNDKRIQFVVNAKEVIFDSVREYDLVAANTLTRTDRDVKHEKALRIARGKWTTEIAFPLSELKVDLQKRRYMGFQVAQSYHNRKDPRLRTVVWDPTGKFPDSTTFGVLVFNKEAFGPGEVEVRGVKRVDRDEDRADFHFDCSLRRFRPGTYRAELRLVGAGENTVESRVTVGSRKDVEQSFVVRRAPNQNGLYTLYLTLFNDRDDVRVCAVNFTNTRRTPDLFGQPLLSPRPKQVKWEEGVFAARDRATMFLQRRATARTKRTAEIFAEKYHGYTGNRLTTRRFGRNIPRRGIVLRIAGSVHHVGKVVKLKPEGYHLAVENDRVVITGGDEPGLYYGTVTFFQLIRNSMKITKNGNVPCVEILDWPDVRYRLARLEHPFTFRNYPTKENRGIDYMIEWTDRFVAGNKMNVFFLDISSRVKYRRRPEFNGSELIYSLDDLKRYGQFCRDNFVDLCPAWQVGCHGSWWLLIGYHPELREKGWKTQTDVTHPDHDKIMLDCMLDVVEALQPKYLSPKSDEWWHNRKPGEVPDPLLHGKTRAEAFLDLHVMLNKWLKKRGITMMIYHDMLCPYHNGKRYDLYKIIDRFPKDIIIHYWGGANPDKGIGYFADRGFRVWTDATGFFVPGEKAKSQIEGFGKGLYSFGNHKNNLLDEYSTLFSMACLIHSADCGWNLSRDLVMDFGRLSAVRNILAVQPNPHAAVEIDPLDIHSHLTHSFDAFLKEVRPKDYADKDTPVEIMSGTQDIGFVPTRIEGENGNNCIILRKGSRDVTIPVNRKCSSLIFLHTGYVNDPNDKSVSGVKRRKWMYGWPCGDYVVRYADGREAVLPVRLTMNIKRFDTSSVNRATNDNRCVYALTDCNGNDVHFYQWEWVNPRPGEEITEITAKHDNELDVSLILFAVSARRVLTGADE